MAESYYGYVDHAVDSQVNWASVGKSISGMIQDEQKRREEKKDELDKMTKEVADKMAEAPVGTQQNVNKFTANYVGDATSLNLLLNKQLKSGLLKPKDFLLRNQNIKQGTESVFSLAKNLEKHYVSTMDGIDKGDYLRTDIWKGMKVEKYSDLNNVRGLFNDTDSSVNLGLFDEKTKKYTNVQSVAFLNNMISRNTAAYKGVDKDIKDFADNKGNILIKSIIQQARTYMPGKSIELKNPDLFDENDPSITKENKERLKKLRESYNKAEDEAVDAIFAAPNGLMTVLMQKLGYNENDILDASNPEDVKEYKASGGKKLLVKVDGNGNVSLDETGDHYKTQKAEALKWAKGQVRVQLDQEIKTEQPLGQLSYPPTPRETGSDKETGTVMDAWMTFYTDPTLAGKAASKQGILNSKGAKDAGLIDIDFSPDKKSYIMKYINGETKTLPIPSNAKLWATAGSNIIGTYKENDLKRYLSQGYGVLNPNETLPAGGFQYGVPAILIGSEDKKVASDLQKNIEKYHKGFIVKPTGWLNDYIQIIAPNDEVSSNFKINSLDMDAARITMDKINQFINDNSTEGGGESGAGGVDYSGK